MQLTGKQVKQLADKYGWQLVKFLPFKNLEGTGRGGYKYKYGLNKPDFVNLSPTYTCCAGGLYFTYIKEGIPNAWADRYVYQVSVPDDARVYFYEMEAKFKTEAG